MAAAISVTLSQSFVLRYASRHSLVPIRDLSLVVEGSSCMREKRQLVFVVSLPVYSSFTRSHSQVRSIPNRP